MKIRFNSINRKKEDAVSPVIGVMLMIVVTIVIAAFVATFASGALSTTEQPPSAMISAEILYNAGPNGDQCIMNIENKGGSAIPSSDLKIVTYYTVKEGSKKGTIKTETLAATATGAKYADAVPTGWGIVPVLSDAGKGGLTGTNLDTSNKELNFGSFNFAPGNIMTTYNSFGTGKVIFGQGTKANAERYLNKQTAAFTDFGLGSVVHVEIIHQPTGTVLYNKDVIVS